MLKNGKVCILQTKALQSGKGIILKNKRKIKIKIFSIRPLAKLNFESFEFKVVDA